MKRYLLSLVGLTLVLFVASYMTLLFAPEYYSNVYPGLAVYFAIVSLAQHLIVTRSTQKDPRTFIRNFFGIILGILLLHFCVLVAYMFSHLGDAQANKVFAIGFCVGYFCHLIFETSALIIYVRRTSRDTDKPER